MTNSFGKNIIPSNESDRLNALYTYKILDTLPERYFDNIVEIMAQVFDMPVALISLVDKERVFFKAKSGFTGTENDRGDSLCSLAILESDILVFEDALKEPCLLANPLVAGDYGLRFYAGAPLVSQEGHNIGTVCIIDKKARLFNDGDKELLKRFASITMSSFERRKINPEQV